MKQILVMMAAVVLVGCSNETPETSQAAEAEPQVASTPTPEPVSPADEKLIGGKPIRMSPAELEGRLTEAKVTPKPTPVSPADEKLIADPIVEKAVREMLKMPEGELTNADLEKVTGLNLSFTKITDAGLKDVAKLQKLEWLYLYGTKITDEGLKEVAKLQQLRQLFLNDTQITDVGLKEVAKLQQLAIIDLDFTKVTKTGVAELRKALPNCRFTAP